MNTVRESVVMSCELPSAKNTVTVNTTLVATGLGSVVAASPGTVTFAAAALTLTLDTALRFVYT